VYIVVLAGLKFYSDCFYFLYKFYQNDFNFSQTVFIVLKDFVGYFIDDMGQTEMRATKILFNDVTKKGFDSNSVEKIAMFLKENKAKIDNFSKDQFFTLKFAGDYSGLKSTDMLNEYVKAKLSIAKSGNDAYIKAFDKVLLGLKDDFIAKETIFFSNFKKLIDELNKVSYASNEEFHKFNGELLKELKKSKFELSNDTNGSKFRDFVTFIHCVRDTHGQIKANLLDKNTVMLYVDFLKGNFSLAGISNEANFDQVRLPKFFGSYYKNALPVFVTQNMLLAKDPLTGDYTYKVGGDLVNFDEKLGLFLFEELKARKLEAVNKDLDALIGRNNDMSVIFSDKDNLFSSVSKQLSRVPEEQRGLIIYNRRDVASSDLKVLDNLADKFSGLNRKALPVAKVTLLAPNAEPLVVYIKK
jgi:hypothetical protein